METVVNFGVVQGYKQSALLARPTGPSSTVSAQCSSQIRISPSLRSRAGGLGSFCDEGICRLKQSVLRPVDVRRSSRLNCRADLSELAELAPITAAVYGASLLGGGLFAFTRTGSKGSLGGGITGGIALGVAFFLMQVPETRDLGQAIGFGSALLFAAIFGIRLVASGKPMPSGALLALSSVATLIFANAYFQARLPGPPL